jgi:hypothetical protein
MHSNSLESTDELAIDDWPVEPKVDGILAMQAQQPA